MSIDIVSVLQTLGPDEIEYYFEGTWRRLSACTGLITDEFFPERGADQEELRKICRSCVVADDCLAYALLANEDYGFWGNASERARRKLRKQLGAKRPDLLKIGTTKKKQRKKQLTKQMSRVIQKAIEDASINEQELIDHLKPKVMALLRLIGSEDRCELEGLMLKLNVSHEAFWQRLNLAKQLGWVHVRGQQVSLSRAGQAALHQGGKIPRSTPTIPITHVEVTMSRAKSGQLNDLGKEVLAYLINNGDIEFERGRSASQLLCEWSGIEPGPRLSTCLARLEELGYLKRKIHGKFTESLKTTASARKAMEAEAPELLTGGKPSTNGRGSAKSTTPASEEVGDWSAQTEAELLEQLESLDGLTDAMRRILAENSRLRQARAEAVQQATEAEEGQRAAAEQLAVAEAELERIRPLAERYEQMQALLTTPT